MIMSDSTPTIELVAPAGNLNKLITALHFGADAVYLAGKRWGLRTQADNFGDNEIIEALRLAHDRGKRVFVALNILAHESDFEGLGEYIGFLAAVGVDGVIVSDLGIMSAVRQIAPTLPIHISTQANITNASAALEYVSLGASRIVLARELTLTQIATIRAKLPQSVSLEAFVHGAMCMSYSGRCLISSFLTDRNANLGSCSQPCRFKYGAEDVGGQLILQEDERGAYIFSSMDVCMIEHIDRLARAGITAFKIEGRVKSEYYVGVVTNAYRKMIDIYSRDPLGFVPNANIAAEVTKVASRGYCTGFYYGKPKQNYNSSQAPCDYEFVAVVTKDNTNDYATIEQRNRFVVGDELEVVSPKSYHNAKITIGRMTNDIGEPIEDAKRVQEHLRLYTDIKLTKGDMLRKRIQKQPVNA